MNNLNIKIKEDIFEETYNIQNFLKNNNSYNSYRIFDQNLIYQFTNNGILKIKSIYNYTYNNINNFSHIYQFYKYNQLYKQIIKKHIDNFKDDIITDEFEIKTFDITRIRVIIKLSNNDINTTSMKLFNNNTIEFIYNDYGDVLKTDVNTNNISSNLTKIGTNETNISSNLSKIGTNETNIASNQEKIDDNRDNVLSLKNSNIKSFYNLDKIFINDIREGYQNVDKDNYFHMFEKEIIHNFLKDSYLEIILKVLPEISNYILIGYFQILCNFYDENNNLLYTISLSTAMGSINNLSIKSVFIVPINKFMNKIKIDFFIAPKEGLENKKAKFIIHDINSNKIYVKYYQKTDEMSIKNNKDSLNNVSNDISSNFTTISKNTSNISSNLEKINNISDIKIEKGGDHYIVKNIHIIDLKDDKDITINQNEFLINQTEIYN